MRLYEKNVFRKVGNDSTKRYPLNDGDVIAEAI